jgi:methylthioribose-1-phosphate isomerase
VSSSTDATDPNENGADPERRRFFRSFAAGAMNAAASLAGAVGDIQREAASAREDLLRGDMKEPLSRPVAPGEGRAGRAAPNDRWASAVVAENDPAGTFRSPYRWVDGRLLLVDQRRLPDELVEVICDTAGDVAAAIRDMVIRGAPAIGQAAAYGMVLGVDELRRDGANGLTREDRDAIIRSAAETLRAARPTAVDLGWAIDRMSARYEAVGGAEADADVVVDALVAEADAIATEAMLEQATLARYGAALMPERRGRALRLLTHCNTGPLAAGQVGTAIGVVQRLHSDGVPLHVWVDESRPYLQGARLTAWELGRAGVPHAVIADAAAGSLMARGEVDAVIVGADRVAANGDVANKIGTYPLAVVAQRHGVPFYVCAPTSSIDLETRDGAAIPIEERPEAEVTTLRGVHIAPADSPAYNPAFDVTPAELVTAIVTEEGSIAPPFADGLAAAVAAARSRRA